ncbi:F-box/RNI-like superfamily protein [Striga asiatica]|uniref:F-box/RNI-like superfamily protein n=1 Tax=Striga asiatica TaxID=4170 RepID=A0A5A7QXW4_STRAF|nr:F-box/RNI-like superfamily protein [Striga asiatica]
MGELGQSASDVKENRESLRFKNKKAVNHAKTEPTSKALGLTDANLVSDKISLLSNEILLNILSKLSNLRGMSIFLSPNGRLVRSIKLLDWDFLISDVGLIILAQGCKRLLKLELMSNA